MRLANKVHRPSPPALLLALIASLAAPLWGQGERGFPILPASESRIVAPQPGDGFLFASDVAACGTTLVVGAVHDGLFANVGGAAYVYEIQGGVPVYVQTLVPPLADQGPGLDFGVDVDVVCGWPVDIIAVAFEPDDNVTVGGAYIYEKDATGTWVQTSIMRPALGVPNDECGASVALDAALIPGEGGEGDQLVYQGVVGCPGAWRYATYTGGAAYLFRRLTSSTWTDGYLLVQSNDLIPGDQHNGDRFGSSVDLHPPWVVVGTPEDFTGGYHGAVHVFGGGGASPCAKLVPDGLPLGAEFGSSVSIDPWNLAVGAFADGESGTTYTGAVYMYDLWGPINLCNTQFPLVPTYDQRLSVPDAQYNDVLGYKVRVETPLVLASLSGRAAGNLSSVGGVAVFVLTEVYHWEALGRLAPTLEVDGAEAVGNGGVALAASHIVVAGSPHDRVVNPAGGSWLQAGSAFLWDAPAVSWIPVFADGFEGGDFGEWTLVIP